MEERQQGMMDGLEMALEVCDRSKTLPAARELISYYLRLIKEEKFEKMKEQLGAFR
jgi:hypothetical protein